MNKTSDQGLDTSPQLTLDLKQKSFETSEDELENSTNDKKLKFVRGMYELHKFESSD